MNVMRIKYSNYEAILIHEKGNRTGFGCDFHAEAIRIFAGSKTAVEMIVLKATHNNTRLKVIAKYDSDYKNILNIGKLG